MPISVFAVRMVLLACGFAITGTGHANDRRTDGSAITHGEVAIDGLQDEVAVKRDRLAIATIEGSSTVDVARAQGFVHAQERFFQMDMLRRLSAGELAEVVGSAMLANDRRMRLYQFRSVARSALELLPDRHRTLIDAYAAGVNEGMRHFAETPPEYMLLKSNPAAWKPEDSLLIVYSMYCMLNVNARFEKPVGVMRDSLPIELFEFLTPDVSEFDVPILKGTTDLEVPLAVPNSDIVDLREREPVDPDSGGVQLPARIFGSNSFAVSGKRTADGRAIVANDPHLPLAVPGIWYRVQLEWNRRRLNGLSLPGLPGIVIGSNGDIAWAFTNSMCDVQDLIAIEVNPDDAAQYRTPDGWEAFETVTESILYSSDDVDTLAIRRTRWGNVIDEDWSGQPLVLKWTALDPEKFNLNLFDLYKQTTVEGALDIGRSWNGPSQNMIVADADGLVGYIVTGYLPNRVGFDGKAPMSWADGLCFWDGPREETQRPQLVGDDVLFTANNRVVSLNQARNLSRCWVSSHRAHRIGELLKQKITLNEQDLLAIQLDTRSEIHDLYRDVILRIVSPADAEPQLRAARELVAAWDGTADADQQGYPIIHEFRDLVVMRILQALTSPCRERDPSFAYLWIMLDQPVRSIVREKPAHLLPPGYESWSAFLRCALRDACDDLSKRFPEQRMGIAWGDVNKARIQHPVAIAEPGFSFLLDMPRDELSGDFYSVRVALPKFGASARMVVSPGHERDGILETPCGQSGNWRSAHYLDGHAAWIKGEPLSLLPSLTRHTLMLSPASLSAEMAD